MNQLVVCIVGKNKSLKSKIIQGLISNLKLHGIKVGVLKNHKHGDFEIDLEGKDTWKYANSGADTVAIISNIKFAVIKKVSSELNIDEITQKYFSDIDIVLADGFTYSNKPRIIVAYTEEDIEFFKRGCDVLGVINRDIEKEDILLLSNEIMKTYFKN